MYLSKFEYVVVCDINILVDNLSFERNIKRKIEKSFFKKIKENQIEKKRYKKEKKKKILKKKIRN